MAMDESLIDKIKDGTAMEKEEHQGTVDMIKQQVEKDGTLPSDEAIFESIATEHISEDENYYNKEKECHDKIEEAVKSFYIDKSYEITQLKDSGTNDKINSRIKFNTYKELINGKLMKKLNITTSTYDWALVAKSDNSKILKWFTSKQINASKFVKTQDGWVGRVTVEDENGYKIKFVDGPEIGKEDTINKDKCEVIKSSNIKKKIKSLDVKSFEKVKDQDGKKYTVLSTDGDIVRLWESDHQFDNNIKEVSQKDFGFMYTKASLYDEKLQAVFSEEDFNNRFNNLLNLVDENKTPVRIKDSKNNVYEVLQTINKERNRYIRVKNIETNEEKSIGSNELKKGFVILNTKKEKVAAKEEIIIGDFENKKAYLERTLVKKYKPEDMRDIFNQIKNADPSGNKADYAIWICNMLMKDIIKFPEDVDKVKEKLTLFDKIKSKVDIKKDINQYKSFGELSEILEPYKKDEQVPETKGETERRKIEEGQKILHDDGTYKIIQVSNPEACSMLFRGTDWCVKDPKWSVDYLKQADLFYFMKNDKPYALFHKPSAQFFDVHDNQLKDSVIEELYPFVKKYLNTIMLEFEGDDIEIV